MAVAGPSSAARKWDVARQALALFLSWAMVFSSVPAAPVYASEGAVEQAVTTEQAAAEEQAVAASEQAASDEATEAESEAAAADVDGGAAGGEQTQGAQPSDEAAGTDAAPAADAAASASSDAPMSEANDSDPQATVDGSAAEEQTAANGETEQAAVSTVPEELEATAQETSDSWVEYDGFPGTSPASPLAAGTYEVKAALYAHLDAWDTTMPFSDITRSASLTVASDGTMTLSLPLIDDEAAGVAVGSLGSGEGVSSASASGSAATFSLSSSSGRYVLEGASVSMYGGQISADTLYLAADLAGAVLTEPAGPSWVEYDGFPGTSLASPLAAGTYEVSAALYAYFDAAGRALPFSDITEAASLTVASDGTMTLSLPLIDDEATGVAVGSLGSGEGVSSASASGSAATFSLSSSTGRYVLTGASASMYSGYFSADTLYLAADLAGATAKNYPEDDSINIANRLTYSEDLAIAPESGVDSLEPGEYLVVANLFVPGELNKILGVNAYICNPGIPPTSYVTTPTTMTVDEDGVATVHLDINSVGFTVQDLGASETATYVAQKNDRVYSDSLGIVGRIYHADITLGNLSGGYDFTGCSEFAVPLAEDGLWNVDLHLSVDLASAKNTATFYSHDFETSDGSASLHVETYDADLRAKLERADFTVEKIRQGDEYDRVGEALDEFMWKPIGNRHTEFKVSLTCDRQDIDLSACETSVFTIYDADRMLYDGKDDHRGESQASIASYLWRDGSLTAIDEREDFRVDDTLTYKIRFDGSCTYVFAAMGDISHGGIYHDQSYTDAATGVSETVGVVDFRASYYMTSADFGHYSLLASKSIATGDTGSSTLDAVRQAGCAYEDATIESAYRVSLVDDNDRSAVWNKVYGSCITYSYCLPTKSSSAQVYYVDVDASGNKTASLVSGVTVSEGVASFSLPTPSNNPEYKAAVKQMGNLWRGATGNDLDNGFGYFVVVTDGADTPDDGDKSVTNLEPGVYTVTANLYVPAEKNTVLGINAYLTNPSNPVEGTGIPSSPVSGNAKLVVAEDGTPTLELDVVNPVFTLQAIDGATNATPSVTAYGDAKYPSGATGTYAKRISHVSIKLKDTSGTYVFADCLEYPTVLGQEWTSPLTLEVDLSGVPTTPDPDPTPDPDKPQAVEAPAANIGLVYNGRTQTGVTSSKAYTLQGATATDAGTYTATATLAAGYEWADGTRAPKTVTWSIAKAKLTATYAGESVAEGAEPAYAVSVTGFVGGETVLTAAGFAVPSIAKADRPAKLEAGKSYDLVPSGGAAKNYSFTYVGGTLKVTAPAGTLAPGTYRITANLYVPGELNSVLGKNAYLTNASTPITDGNAPLSPVADNATLVVRADGSRVLVIPVVNPVFTLQAAASGSNVKVLGQVRDSQTYSDTAGTTSRQGRITMLYLELGDDSGLYQLGECAEFPTLLGVDWNVPLRVSVDFSSAQKTSDVSSITIPGTTPAPAPNPGDNGADKPGQGDGGNNGANDGGTDNGGANPGQNGGQNADQGNQYQGGEGLRLAAGTYTVSANIWLSDRAATGLPLMPYLTSSDFPPMYPVTGNATLTVDESGHATLRVPITIQGRVMTVSGISGLDVVGVEYSGGSVSAVTIDLGVITDMSGVITLGCSATIVMGSLASTISGITGSHTWPATFQVVFTGVPVSGNAGSSYDWASAAAGTSGLAAGVGALAATGTGAAADMEFLSVATKAATQAALHAACGAAEASVAENTSGDFAAAGVSGVLAALDPDAASGTDATAALALAAALTGEDVSSSQAAGSFATAFVGSAAA